VLGRVKSGLGRFSWAGVVATALDPACALQRGVGVKERTMQQTPQLSHHRFRVAVTARQLAVLVKRQPIGDAHLRNQAQRAAVSVACNLAESCGYDGAAKKRFLSIARGSALEVAVAYEIAGDLGDTAPVEEVLRLVGDIVAVLTKLSR
jgi:four helix bundle protein